MMPGTPSLRSLFFTVVVAYSLETVLTTIGKGRDVDYRYSVILCELEVF